MHINTAAEHSVALARIEQLMGWGEGHLTATEGDELKSLAVAVEAYENIHHNIGKPTAEEAAAFRAEQEAVN